jgi:polysaccharide export outer membrane protein
LRVIVFGQDNLSNSYNVDSSGHISMPLIGLVNAQGLTPSQLKGSIESRLRAGFLRDPHVSVEIEAYRPFFILGEVTTAGQYPYVNGLTVQTAVAIAGGFTPRGAKSTAAITRNTPSGAVTYEVPMTWPVRPGDTVVIHERFL